MTRAVARAFAPAMSPVDRMIRPIAHRRGWTRQHGYLVLALGLVYLLWGSGYVGVALVIETMPPMLAMAGRFALAGGVLFLVASRRGDRHGDRVTLRQVVQAILNGSGMLVGGIGFIAIAQGSISSGLAALLAATVPLWLALFARGAFGEVLSVRAWLGLAVGLGGIALLVEPGGGHVGAIILALVGSAMWAAGSLRSRVADAPRRPMVGASLEMMGGAVGFVIVGLALGEASQLDLRAVSASSWAGFVFLVIGGSLVAFTAYSWLLRNASTSLVATHAYINPIVAAIVGWLLLGETIDGRTMIAGAIILASVVLLITGRPGEPVPAQLTSGADVFAGASRWRRIRRKVGSLPSAARLYRNPGAQPYRSTGIEPPAYRFDEDADAGDHWAATEFDPEPGEGDRWRSSRED